jgi:glycosyltransferase involved in cell wall biosynthesis
VTDFTSSAWGIHDAQSVDSPIPTGCGWYRVKMPMDQLAAHGWKIRYQAFTPPAEVAEYKLIVAERLDKAEVLGDWRRFKPRHRLCYELDDDVWSVDMANVAAHQVYRQESVQDAVQMACAVADLVTVTTEPLAEMIRTRTGQRNVAVIPNFIPESMLAMERPRREHVTVGWAGGVSHTWDVSLIGRAVRQVMDQDRSLRLHIVGSDFRPTFGHSGARHTHWEPLIPDYYRHLDFDIGLAPLAETKFNESKSPLKALEYGALGIPVIASDFGPYAEFVQDGVTGFLVRKEKEWRDRIRELAADEDLRETMGKNARQLAAQHTIEGNWWRWAEAYRSIIE